MKIIISLFMFLSFFMESTAGFYPYNPGPGFLPPSYSYQPYSYQRPYQQTYYNQAPASASPLTCTAISCDNLKGFKNCLEDPSSPYRYFAYHPAEATYITALERLRAFTAKHPNCYASFCNRVCASVPEKFQAATGVELKKRNWFGRQKDRLQKNENWQAHELQKRAGVETQVADLCNRQDITGREIRILCSECPSFMKPDRQIIPACRVNINYTSKLKVKEGAAPTEKKSESQQEKGSEEQETSSGDNWGLQVANKKKPVKKRQEARGGRKTEQETEGEEQGKVMTNARGERFRLVDGQRVDLGRPPQSSATERRLVTRARPEEAQIDREEDEEGEEGGESEGEEEEVSSQKSHSRLSYALPARRTQEINRRGNQSRSRLLEEESDSGEDDGEEESDAGDEESHIGSQHSGSSSLTRKNLSKIPQGKSRTAAEWVREQRQLARPSSAQQQRNHGHGALSRSKASDFSIWDEDDSDNSSDSEASSESSGFTRSSSKSRNLQQRRGQYARRPSPQPNYGFAKAHRNSQVSEEDSDLGDEEEEEEEE